MIAVLSDIIDFETNKKFSLILPVICIALNFSIVHEVKVESQHLEIMTNFDEEEKIWSAAHTPTIFNPKNSMGHAILWSMERSPNKIVQVKQIDLTF